MNQETEMKHRASPHTPNSLSSPQCQRTPGSVEKGKKNRGPKPIILDTYRYDHVIPSNICEGRDTVDSIYQEIGSWAELIQNGKPLPRIVAVQGDVDESLGIEPLYRDLHDYQPELTPWTPTVKALRDVVSNIVLQPLNHAVICYYRHGEDYLSETSSPTLDLFTDSSVVKLSLGATRTVILRPKRKSAGVRRPSPRPTTKVVLKHGSLLRLGPKTNRFMTHEIKRISHYPSQASKRGSVGTINTSTESGEEQRISEHVRICITFRHVATFQTDDGRIFGKGATGSILGRSVSSQLHPAKKAALLRTLKAAFFQESRDTDFDRIANYSAGFDVIPHQYVTTVSCKDICCFNNDPDCTVLTSLNVEDAFSEEDDFMIKTTSSSDKLLHYGNVAKVLSSGMFDKGKFEDEDDEQEKRSYIPFHHAQHIFVKRKLESDLIPEPSTSGSRSRTFSEASSAFADDEQVLSLCPTSTSIADMSVRSEQTCSVNNGVALLALDLQNDFLSDDPSFYYGKKGSPFASRREGLLKRIAEIANEVRRLGGVVFMVKSQYGAWSSPQSTEFRRFSEAGAHMDRVDCCGVSSAGADFHPDVENMIVNQDIILIKEWHSAFMGTTLDKQLQRLKVGHVVVCGVTTDHSVAATVRSAANLGYNVILSSDGTAQANTKMQQGTERRLSKYYSKLLGKRHSLTDFVAPDPFLEALADPGPIDMTGSLEIDAYARLSGFGAGDSIIVPDFLDQSSALEMLGKMLPDSSNELKWSQVAGAGGGSMTASYHLEPNDKGHLPVYRSNIPQPWDPNFKGGAFPDTVQKLKSLTESQAGHKLNWGQILCYRDGSESSGWDAEKNLDVRAGSTIAAVSLGGDRVLELKPKKGDSSLVPQRIRLEHNSLLLLGPETTRLFLHSLPPDEGSSSPHIQCTFLEVATFFAQNDSRTGVPALYGQGTEYGSHTELQEAEATRRMMEQLGMALAGVYTMTTVPVGRGGSFGLSVICTVVVAAGTAMWFKREREHAWSEHQRRLQKLFEECTEEPLSVEEARHRILKTTK